MDGVKYFFTTEVKAKNIAIVERVANFFLIPAQYLWNGKKIDFIQGPNREKAVQIDVIFRDTQFLWIKIACMIMLLIPGLLVGGVLKAYATCRHHVKEDDDFMKKCLEKHKKLKEHKILASKGHHNFATNISELIQTIRSTGSLGDEHLTDSSKPLFLSEIQDMRLIYEKHHPSGGQCVVHDSPAAVMTNRKILDNIHFLWNLSYFNLADHFIVSTPGTEVPALKAINPYVVSFQLQSGKRSEAVKARDFSFDTNTPVKA